MFNFNINNQLQHVSEGLFSWSSTNRCAKLWISSPGESRKCNYLKAINLLRWKIAWTPRKWLNLRRSAKEDCRGMSSQSSRINPLITHAINPDNEHFYAALHFILRNFFCAELREKLMREFRSLNIFINNVKDGKSEHNPSDSRWWIVA